jgi:transcriptional regulator
MGAELNVTEKRLCGTRNHLSALEQRAREQRALDGISSTIRIYCRINYSVRVEQ